VFAKTKRVPPRLVIVATGATSLSGFFLKKRAALLDPLLDRTNSETAPGRRGLRALTFEIGVECAPARWPLMEFYNFSTGNSRILARQIQH
jgi:hypothetical protein